MMPDDASTCDVSELDATVHLIKDAKAIVWDEAPMSHRYLLEALDRTEIPHENTIYSIQWEVNHP